MKLKINEVCDFARKIKPENCSWKHEEEIKASKRFNSPILDYGKARPEHESK